MRGSACHAAGPQTICTPSLHVLLARSLHGPGGGFFPSSSHRFRFASVRSVSSRFQPVAVAFVLLGMVLHLQASRVEAQEGVLRYHIPIWDQFSYTVPHPLAEIRGEDSLADAPGSLGGLFYLRRRAVEAGESLPEQILRWLPSFGFEYGFSTTLRFPASYALGVDFLHVSSTLHREGIQPINIDSYYAIGVIRAYFFEYGEAGINYFVGVGSGAMVGLLEGKPHSYSEEREAVDYQLAPLGVSRLGIEYVFAEEKWSFRYEVGNMNADEVRFERNPYDGQAEVKTADFSGTYIRVGFTYKP